MKYLVAKYDYEDVEHFVVDVPEELSKDIFNLLCLDVVASGDFNSKEKKIDIKKDLVSCLKTEYTAEEASEEWEKYQESLKNMGSVTYSGSVDMRDLPKDKYIKFWINESRKNRKHNLKIKELLEKLND